MKKKELIEIGKRVKSIREALNIPQKDFAASLNFTPSYLSQIERGKKNNPGIAIYLNIAKIYNVSLDFLFTGTGDMFLSSTLSSQKSRKSHTGKIESMEDLIWYMENSPFFKNVMMGIAFKIHIENEDIIKRSLNIQGDKKGE